MRKQIVGWSGALALVLCTQAALAETIPFSENFDNVAGSTGTTSFTDGSTGNSFNVVGSGSVDTIFDPAHHPTLGIACHNNSDGCVDLDGTGTPGTAPLLTSGTFSLLGGHTYQLQAWISGSQRPGVSGAADDVTLGFYNSALVPGALSIISTGLLAAADTTFHLFTVLYTPGSTILGRVGFWNTTAGDNAGAILDDISVTDITAVPLPASAWLLISGLLAMVAIARRQRGGAVGFNA